MDIGKARGRGSSSRSTIAALLSVMLVASAISGAGMLAPAYAITDPVATMDVWSPHSSAAVDGSPVSLFTYYASASASAGLARVEWDFDGDGTADATTSYGGETSVSASTTHVYEHDGVNWPQVRAVDINGATSAWNRYQESGADAPLDVFWPPPFITMLRWQPFAVSIGTPVTFSASAFNEVGVKSFQWDFNGDEDPDASSPADVPGAQSATGSIQFTYTGPVAGFPAVRAIDNNDFISEWDVYDVNGQPVQLVVGASAPPTVTMNQWSPYSATGPDGFANTLFTFSASAMSSTGLARIEWDFNDDAMVDATTALAGQTLASASATYTYNSVGTWIPKARSVDTAGLASGWTPYQVGGSPVALDTAPPAVGVTLNFGPRAPSDVGPDGNTATVFTFTATLTTIGVTYDWDFNGDGVTDATTAVPTATYSYPSAGTYLPSVKVRDVFGALGSAVPINGQGQDVWLDVDPVPPVVTLNQWSPYSATGPDGTKYTSFTFSADASSQIGIAKLEWDFNGDGTVDATTNIAGTPTTVTGQTASFTYGADGTFTPKVRAVDSANNKSAWDAYNILLTTIQLDVVTPPVTVTMNPWSPYSATGPDGVPSTLFTFSASGTSPAGILLFEWDFDGNGSVDATTVIAGSPASATGTATYTYNASGNFTPMVRLVDARGATTWAPYNVGSTTVQLDISAPPSMDLYCGGKTIDQLVASHLYNVIDNRNGHRKTLNGTDGKDLILASRYGDVINGKKGEDCLIGGAGDDIIHGHQGHDQIFGNGGNDRLFGDDGNDKIYGGAGNDAIYGDNGDDYINGGSGNDEIDGGNGNDEIDNGDGNNGSDDYRGHDHKLNI